MTVYLVRLGGSILQHEFRIEGMVQPSLEALVTRTIDRFYAVTGPLAARLGVEKVYTVHLEQKGRNNYAPGNRLNLNTLNLTEWTITHELAHALDAAHGWRLSQQMRAHTGSGFLFKALHYARPAWKVFWYRVGSPPPPCGVDKNFNSLEDFAETVTAYIFPAEAHRRAEQRGYAYEKWGYTHFHETPRGQFFANLLNREAIKTPSG